MIKVPREPRKFKELLAKADEALDGLKTKVRELPHLQTLAVGQGTKTYSVGNGKSLAWTLLSEPKVAVARWFNEAGTRFPPHAHQEREWLIVYSGEIVIEFEDGTSVRVGEGQHVEFEAGVVHGGYSDEDAWFVAVTVPRSPDYPE